jgi:thymidylate synthase
MSKFERDYKVLLNNALSHGESKSNRTDVKTLTLFNQCMNIDLREGFPIVTSKKVFFKKGYHEYIWMRDGMHTTKYLNEYDIHWWNQYANDKGDLGKVYGYQLRNFNGVFDQLDYVYKEIRSNTRRAHITLWNPTELNEMALPPCYTGFTFVRINNKLNMSIKFRSSDLFLGLPYDIIVAALMLHDVAKFCDLEPCLLGLQIDDAHIYENHIDQVNKYLNRPTHALPKLNDKNNEISDYLFGPLIKAELNN